MIYNSHKTIGQLFDECDKMKIFEIQVIDKRTDEIEYIIFDIKYDAGTFFAYHEAISEAEAESLKIPFVKIQADNFCSLDENLQDLYSECIDKINNSQYFRTND